MRHQLNEERQNVRRLTLQREVEVKELRNTIDSQVCQLKSLTVIISFPNPVKGT